ncbi:peptidase inhibitor family I36 protein [Saccharopolyspora pogona]|uniref:peptidase inhibitor family I36 protein n=1 Tax=Saccharopolyspora pogona TaxID=333966 RepID=UPI0016889EDF|nr:peptidase inhibitor family I36 protein [Saccharopolyspora pogona]
MSKFACAAPLCVGTRSSSWRRTGRTGVWRIFVPALFALAAISVGSGGAYAAPPEKPCAAGTFCSYPEEEYAGQVHEVGLQTTTLEQCVQLRQDVEVRSFVNNTGHPVTVYQDPYCDSGAEFATYPTGSQTPRATYVARAIKIWSH